MGCGCKKKNEAQPVQQPTNVTIKLQENQAPDVNLTPEQQQQVDAIVDKLKQINS
jgi:Spy/CpxP family protein refolding chaperone